VTRTIAAVVRRGTPLRAGVNVVLDALRQQPELPALADWADGSAD
jgi:hypothetical protein